MKLFHIRVTGGVAHPTRLVTLILALLPAMVFASPSHGGQIVFSAREYLKPGASGQSHSHIYLTNADGTGQAQLTSGTCDDYEPKFSPDGKWVAFMRSLSEQSTGDEYCVLSIASWHVINLEHGEWSDMQWREKPLRVVLTSDPPAKPVSICVPSGQRFSGDQDESDLSPNKLWSAKIDSKNLLSVRRFFKGKWIAFDTYPGNWTSIYWLDPTRLAGLTDDTKDTNADVDDINLHVFDFPTQPFGDVRMREYAVTKLANDWNGGEMDNQEGINDLDSSCVWPGHPDEIVIQANEHNSTVGTAAGYLALNLKTGTIKLIQDYATFISLSPDGSYFVYAPGRDAVPYSRWRNDQIRSVWAAPLYSVNLKTGKHLLLTPRTAYVDSADWRR